MSEVTTIPAGTLGTEELLTLLHEERHIQIVSNQDGGNSPVTLRYDGQPYYCDTGTKLRRSGRKKDMEKCIKDLGYASDG